MSILDNTINSKDMEISRDSFLKVFMAGPTGSGKTMGATTLPHTNGKPHLLLDLDGRAETVAGEEGIEILRLYDAKPESPKAWDNVESVRKELSSMARTCRKTGKEFPYSAIIEDGLSSLATVAMNSALLLDNKRGLGGAPAKQHYMPQITYLKKHINAMRVLPCHYVLTSHFELLTDEESGEIKVLPKVTRSLRTELPSWFNESYRCYRESIKGKTRYFWMTAGTGKYEFFKSALNKRGKFWKDPIEVDFDDPPVGFERLLAHRFGDLKWESSLEKEEKGGK